MGRFVDHLRKGWLKAGVEWTDEHSEAEAMRLLKASVRLREAMRAVRHGDQDGLRRVLDVVTRRLQKEALIQWVEARILPQLQDLSVGESLQAARGYLQEFGILGMKLESLESIVARRPQTLRAHVRIALT